MFKNESHPVTNKKFSRLFKNKASGDAEELDKYGRTIRKVEMVDVLEMDDRHFNMDKKFELNNAHKMPFVFFQNAKKGEIDFNHHEKVALVAALKCTIEYLYRAVWFSKMEVRFREFLVSQKMGGISQWTVKKNVFELYKILTDPQKTFTFIDRRRRCEIARQQLSEAERKNKAYLLAGKHAPIAYWKFKCAAYNSTTEEEQETALSIESQAHIFMHNVQVDDKLLYFGTSLLDRAIEIFNQIVSQIKHGDPGSIIVFTHMIKSGNVTANW